MELGFVQKQLTTLQKQYQDVLEQAGYYQAQHDALQKQPVLPATSTSTLPLPEPAHTTITTKHTKLPDPPVFMENLWLDDISLDIWKIKMADKIGQDEACYLNALAQLHYIFLQVGGVAQVQLELYAENNYTKVLSNAQQHPNIPAYQTMFTILDNVFGDLDQANTARTKLTKLNQGRKPFAEHYAKFMHYMPRQDMMRAPSYTCFVYSYHRSLALLCPIKQMSHNQLRRWFVYTSLLTTDNEQSRINRSHA